MLEVEKKNHITNDKLPKTYQYDNDSRLTQVTQGLKTVNLGLMLRGGEHP
jgi:hypothetical protein